MPAIFFAIAGMARSYGRRDEQTLVVSYEKRKKVIQCLQFQCFTAL